MPLHAQHVVGIDRQHRLHLGDDLVGPGVLQVDLVEHRHDGQVVLHGQVGVGDGLGLDALEGIDQQDGPLAAGQAARHLVLKSTWPGVSIRFSSYVWPLCS